MRVEAGRLLKQEIITGRIGIFVVLAQVESHSDSETRLQSGVSQTTIVSHEVSVLEYQYKHEPDQTIGAMKKVSKARQRLKQHTNYLTRANCVSTENDNGYQTLPNKPRAEDPFSGVFRRKNKGKKA
jgi:hypothetical protein